MISPNALQSAPPAALSPLAPLARQGPDAPQAHGAGASAPHPPNAPAPGDPHPTTTPAPPPEVMASGPVLWAAQIDPVAVHAAVLIAQEAYRNQKALEGLAMLVQVASGARTEAGTVQRLGSGAQVRPATPSNSKTDDGLAR